VQLGSVLVGPSEVLEEVKELGDAVDDAGLCFGPLDIDGVLLEKDKWWCGLLGDSGGAPATAAHVAANIERVDR
jgi:hypothetical protein